MIYRKNIFYDTEKVERRCGMLRRVTQESLFRSTVTALSHRKKARSARREKQYQSAERHKPLYINTLTKPSENRAYAATHAPVREKTALARLTLLPDE